MRLMLLSFQNLTFQIENEIYDRLINEPLEKKLDDKCEACGCEKYFEWDYESKKCPQGMDGVIEEDDSGFVIMADVTPLFYILYQNIDIAVTIEIL